MDIEQAGELIRYLRESGRIGAGESPEVRVLGGGVSNRTVWVGRATGEQWVLKQALEKLRVPSEWLSSPERIWREALGMRWLGELLPAGAVPRLIFEDPEHYLLCMSAAPEPHRNWKSMLLQGELRDGHIDQFARLLGAIHAGGVARRDAAEHAFGDTSFFESLRLEPYYGHTATQVPAAAPFLEALMADTRRIRLTIVHGDYSPKNILVREDSLILLDHEVIHFGDPAFDVGFSLTHLLSKAHHLVERRGAFAAAAVRYWREYIQAVPDPGWAELVERRAVRHTLACLAARVDGRSKLEYLTAVERDAQRAAVLDLMQHCPRHVPELIHEFITRLS